MNITLNNYIEEFGRNAIWETETLCEYLAQKGVDKKTIFHLSLVLNYGDIKEIVDRTEQKVSSVMLNTVITNTVNNTGLKQYVVQSILSDIFSALNISYDGNTLFGFDTETGRHIPISGPVFPTDTEKLLSLAKKLMEKSKESDTAQTDQMSEILNIAHAVQIYEELSKSGSPEAMYMLGVIKRQELGREFNRIHNRVLTAKERKHEQELIDHLFRSAATNGFAEAKVELADMYYDNFEFDKAYEYYSAPGVVTVKPDSKNKIVAILNQRTQNVWLLVLGGVLLIGMWVFMILNPISIHAFSALFGWGIVINSIVSLIYAYMCFSIQKNRYKSHKLFIVVMLILWFIYPLILAIN